MKNGEGEKSASTSNSKNSGSNQKQLPPWLREGLEKMKNEKQKKTSEPFSNKAPEVKQVNRKKAIFLQKRSSNLINKYYIFRPFQRFSQKKITKMKMVLRRTMSPQTAVRMHCLTVHLVYLP